MKFANSARLKPFARMVVGETSDAQTNDGASTHCKCVNIESIRRMFDTYLKEHDVYEHEDHAGSISSFFICAEILPLKKGFC